MCEVGETSSCCLSHNNICCSNERDRETNARVICVPRRHGRLKWTLNYFS